MYMKPIFCGFTTNPPARKVHIAKNLATEMHFGTLSQWERGIYTCSGFAGVSSAQGHAPLAPKNLTLSSKKTEK